MFRRCAVRAVALRSAASRGVATMAVRRVAPLAAAAVCRAEFVSMRTYADAPSGDQPRSGQYLLNKEDVLTRVLEVVKNFEKVDASKVTAQSHFVNDLGLDSLDVVEVVMALEQEFILDIPDHDAEKIQSIPDAVEYIAQNPMSK